MSNRRKQIIEPEVHKPLYPSHWRQGALLDLRRFTDGSFRATLLGEEYDPTQDNAIHFTNSLDAQNFVSRWYSRTVDVH